MSVAVPHLLITTCTTRKKGPLNKRVTAEILSPGTQDEVTKRWRKAVESKQNDQCLVPAIDVYAGRGFIEAKCASSSPSKLWIISAGLGLVNANQPIPIYGLSATHRGRDSIGSKVEKFDLSQWWADVSNLATSDGKIYQLLDRYPRHLVLLTLSSAYFELVKSDLLSLKEAHLNRIRIFGLSKNKLEARIANCVMPYDSRIDGPDSPIPGTKSDLAQRAARHFREHVLSERDTRSSEEHAKAVETLISDWRPAAIHNRKKITDKEARILIESNWNRVGGKSTAMLRLFRDNLNVACEQSRFQKLFYEVSNNITNATSN